MYNEHSSSAPCLPIYLHMPSFQQGTRHPISAYLTHPNKGLEQKTKALSG